MQNQLSRGKAIVINATEAQASLIEKIENEIDELCAAIDEHISAATKRTRFTVNAPAMMDGLRSPFDGNPATTWIGTKTTLKTQLENFFRFAT